MPTAADREAVRDWVGSTPDDPQIDAALTRFDGVGARIDLAALSILRRRRVDLTTRPGTWSNEDGWSENWTQVGGALDQLIGHLEARTGGQPLPVVTTAQLVRPDHSRGWGLR